jgi:hypothetical protein
MGFVDDHTNGIWQVDNETGIDVWKGGIYETGFCVGRGRVFLTLPTRASNLA